MYITVRTTPPISAPTEQLTHTTMASVASTCTTHYEFILKTLVKNCRPPPDRHRIILFKQVAAKHTLA